MSFLFLVFKKDIDIEISNGFRSIFECLNMFVPFCWQRLPRYFLPTHMTDLLPLDELVPLPQLVFVSKKWCCTITTPTFCRRARCAQQIVIVAVAVRIFAGAALYIFPLLPYR